MTIYKLNNVFFIVVEFLLFCCECNGILMENESYDSAVGHGFPRARCFASPCGQGYCWTCMQADYHINPAGNRQAPNKFMDDAAANTTGFAGGMPSLDPPIRIHDCSGEKSTFSDPQYSFDTNPLDTPNNTILNDPRHA